MGGENRIMKVKKVVPNVTTYHMRFTKEEDPDMHWRCMWARVTLDHDNFTLSAVSDCGDYTYSWHITESETFLHLMCRINSDYLLGKISNRSEFDLEESKKETISNIREYYSEIENIEDKIQEIEEIEEGGEEGFYIRVDSIMDGDIDFESISCVKDYPEGAKVFCRIFEEYLKPLLRQEVVDDQPK